ncbi:NADH-dependent flavin oxidoreductase [Lactococcus nasutitermitis]|uniref:NADH-dependent flavin oxidoreductase n=1 Tax=Lactococcus nasutitermitis TaxID=1652957 RepID=A0ABV9JD53_9LACT|nr:NADH-dependent flavin oxidoreductase [Lactococcus nasutitermitis]
MAKYNEALTLRSGITLKNRLIMAPMTIVSSFHDGAVTQEEIAHYQRRAKGVAAVITGTANVTDNGKGWPGELTIATDNAIPNLTKLTEAVHSQGAKAILQIFHAGRMTHATTIGEQPASASTVAAEVPDAELPRELTNAEILEIIEAFGQATRRAIAAGFDGVEIHGANMYLIHQFFSPHSNRRTDAWGGSLEKRAAFPLAVVKRVLAEVKQAERPFLVGYRFSPVEGTTPGIRLEDTFYLLEQLKTQELDYLHVSLRHYERKSNSPDFQEKSELAYLHEALAGAIPLIGVGGVRTGNDVDNLLENAEFCAIGQQLLIDPEFPVKVLENRADEAVTKSFAEGIYDVEMSEPTLRYLEKRYN